MLKGFLSSLPTSPVALRVESWRPTLCSVGMVASAPRGCWNRHGMPFPISSRVSAQLTSPWLQRGKGGLETSQLQSCRNHIAPGSPGSQQLRSHQGTPLPHCPGTPMGPWMWGPEREVPPASPTAALQGARGLHQRQSTSWVVFIILFYLHEDKLRLCLYNFSLNTWQSLKKNKKQKQTGKKKEKEQCRLQYQNSTMLVNK